MAGEQKVNKEHTSTVSIDMITWNLSHSGQKKNPNLNRFTFIRNAVVEVVRPLLKKDTVSFLQDFTVGVVTKTSMFKEVVSDSEKRNGDIKTAVSTPRSEQKGLEIQPGDMLGKDKLGEYGVDEKLLKNERICGRTVTIVRKRASSEYACEIALLSYREMKWKQVEIGHFFTEMCNLADNMKMTIIIGGTFRLPVIEWKDKVEKERVRVVSSIDSPRLGEKYVDTFAIVQPTDKRDRTECDFKNAYAIYPFPLLDHVGGAESLLIKYPSDENPRFKCIHYSEEDRKKVLTELENKPEYNGDKKALCQLNGTQQNTTTVMEQMADAAMSGAVDQQADAQVDLLAERVRNLEIRMIGVEESVTTLSSQLPEAEPAIRPTR